MKDVNERFWYKFEIHVILNNNVSHIIKFACINVSVTSNTVCFNIKINGACSAYKQTTTKGMYY